MVFPFRVVSSRRPDQVPVSRLHHLRAKVLSGRATVRPCLVHRSRHGLQAGRLRETQRSGIVATRLLGDVLGRERVHVPVSTKLHFFFVVFANRSLCVRSSFTFRLVYCLTRIPLRAQIPIDWRARLLNRKSRLYVRTHRTNISNIRQSGGGADCAESPRLYACDHTRYYNIGSACFWTYRGHPINLAQALRLRNEMVCMSHACARDGPEIGIGVATNLAARSTALESVPFDTLKSARRRRSGTRAPIASVNAARRWWRQQQQQPHAHHRACTHRSSIILYCKWRSSV